MRQVDAGRSRCSLLPLRSLTRICTFVIGPNLQDAVTEEISCFLYELTVYITDGWQAHQNEAVTSCMSNMLCLLSQV